MQQELTLFKDLFKPFENISILHINNGVDFLNPVIKEVVDSLHGEFEHIVFENESSAKLKGTARDYEYIVLGDILSHCPNKDKILKIIYKALENSADLVIIEKKSHNNIDEIKQLLDKTNFVAINHIDLFDEYMIITAKKLHMWGNGL